ncbi:hypothetical protein V7S43_007852 [Phytophthora oleae]|uniref:Uncharacterized protein n=1 Tax=Phytophthora oleae TaxID=2107226 RepID=A0ABD3FJ11_9STRA
MRFGNLVRTRNNDRIEFRTTSSLISGKCKEYNSAVGLGVMKSILMCVPEGPMVHLALTNTLQARSSEPMIHLVVTNSLQKKYFPAESSWETFVREQSLQNVDFYRISKGSTLQEVKGMINQSSSTAAMTDKKLVLLIELGK